MAGEVSNNKNITGINTKHNTNHIKFLGEQIKQNLVIELITIRTIKILK